MSAGWRTITVAAPPTAANLKASIQAARSVATRPADAMTSDRLPATNTYGTRFTTKTKITSSKTSTESNYQVGKCKGRGKFRSRVTGTLIRRNYFGRLKRHFITRQSSAQSNLHELPSSEDIEKEGRKELPDDV